MAKILVFKIAGRQHWNSSVGAYLGSADDIRDGFIHLSTGAQVQGTLQKHFSGVAGLVIAAFPAEALGAQLRWEKSRGGELFPHYYGALPRSAALWTRPIPDDPARNGIDAAWLEC